MRFMGTHFTYGRPIKPHHTCIYESRIWVCKSQRRFYTGLPATGLGFKNRKGDTVKISMSRHTCRKKGALTLAARELLESVF